MLIEKGYDYVFQGPCIIKKIHGKLLLKGKEIENAIEIKDNEYFSLVPLENSEVDTNCIQITKMPHLGWEEIIQNISMTGGTILLLGSIDSGKTYFSTIVRNLLDSLNIDIDVGQSTYFIPTFISAFSNSLDLEFFGNITPSVNPRLHVQLASKIFERNKSRITVIDTDGWIRGFKAYLHKLELIYTIDPDYIIVFDKTIASSLPSQVRSRVILANSAPSFLAKDRKRRVINRIKKYMEYFKDSRIVEIEYDSLFGNKLANNLILAWGESLQLSTEQPCYGYYISMNDLKGLLLGLTFRGKVVGAGYIRDFTENTIKISTPVSQFDGIIPGGVSLNDRFEDKRIRFKKCE